MEETPFIPPKPKTSILPLIFGFLVVIILAAVFGVVYYKNKLTISSSPTPTSSSVVLASIEPSFVPSSTPSASPKTSVKPTSKPTLKPVSTQSPIPTPTPVPQPTLDIRFGNPSANVKQTYDDGSGAGRIINREYSSIQVGQFDEVTTSWSPRVTTCFHIVTNEEIKGTDLYFTFTLDDKVEDEGSLGGYDKLEAGKLYDWCHDTTNNLGKHTAKLLLNPNSSLKESNYVNNLARIEFENLADKIAPNITLGGPFDWDDKGTCFLIVSLPTDNVTLSKDLVIEQKIDSGSWTSTSAVEYCFSGTQGDAHTYGLRTKDARGNVNEQNKSFVLY